MITLEALSEIQSIKLISLLVDQMRPERPAQTAATAAASTAVKAAAEKTLARSDTELLPVTSTTKAVAAATTPSGPVEGGDDGYDGMESSVACSDFLLARLGAVQLNPALLFLYVMESIRA